MDRSVLAAKEPLRGTYMRQTGRVACEKGAGFRDVMNSTLGTNRTPKVPYEYLAKDGVITYKGVQFVCDYKEHAICLGDVSDRRQTLTIPLSNGGSLKVNRSQIGTLSKAIGMFSPEDVNLILRAIAMDQKCQQELNKIDELENDPENVMPTENEE